MAKLFDKISADFLAAIKGVVESTAAFEKARDEEKKARMSGEDKDKVAKLAAMMSKEKKLRKEEAEQVDEKLSDEAKAAIRHAAGGGAKVKPLVKLAKMAKDKKAANEEVEQVDELSRATVGRYSMKAKSIADNEGGKDRSKGRELAGRKRWGGSMSGVKPARVPATEEVEQVNELSSKKLGQYISATAAKGKEERKARAKGLATAVDKMSYPKGSPLAKKVPATEEVQIDELSKATMGRYINKAAERMSTQGVTAGLKIAADEKSKKNFDNIKKREKGIKTAVDKLTREEIEMIEAKLAGVAPGALEGDKHMCATKVFHKEWKEGTPIKTMHADPDADGLIEWYDVMFDHGIERVMTEDMEILQQESHMHSKRKMKMEDVDQVDESVAAAAKHLIKRYGDNVRKSHVRSAANDLGVGYVALSHHVRKKLGVNRLEEARGRPKKAAAKDFTVHPKTGEKLMHNNPEHMKKIEALQKTGALQKPKTEAGQHIINQLRKASTSMQGGATVHFTHGESKHVTAAHAGKALDKYAGMKPHEKEAFQKKISHSHEEMMKHI